MFVGLRGGKSSLPPQCSPAKSQEPMTRRGPRPNEFIRLSGLHPVLSLFSKLDSGEFFELMS